MVRVGNNKVMRSFGPGTVLVTILAGEATHNVALQDVIFALNMMLGLISASLARKSGFPINMDEDDKSCKKGKLGLFHRPFQLLTLTGWFCVFNASVLKLCAFYETNREWQWSRYRFVFQTFQRASHYFR